MYSIFDVAKYIYDQKINGLTHKKMQKLCYYIQAWSLAIKEEPLIKCEFEAWVHGPVCKELYDKCKYGVETLSTVKAKPLDDEDEEFINRILSIYKDDTGYELEQLTHSEEPWQKAREGYEYWETSREIIDNDIMKTYYKSLLES